jgi:hypothetical protein
MQVVRHESERARWETVSRDAPARLRAYVRSYTGYRERTADPLRRREVPSADVTLILSPGPALSLPDPVNPDRPPDRRVSFVAGLHDRPALVDHDGEQPGGGSAAHPDRGAPAVRAAHARAHQSRGRSRRPTGQRDRRRARGTALGHPGVGAALRLSRLRALRAAGRGAGASAGAHLGLGNAPGHARARGSGVAGAGARLESPSFDSSVSACPSECRRRRSRGSCASTGWPSGC